MDRASSFEGSGTRCWRSPAELVQVWDRVSPRGGARGFRVSLTAKAGKLTTGLVVKGGGGATLKVMLSALRR